LSTLPEELFAPAAEHEAGPHKKMKRKKEVTEAPGSPLSAFPSFPLISSTFSFGMKKCRIFSNFSA
jgi:hypothetical protein